MPAMPDPEEHIEADGRHDRAALWLAKRAGGSLTPAEATEMEAWLNAEPANRRAFDEMRVLWARLDEPARNLAARRRPARLMGATLFRPRSALSVMTVAGLACLGLWLVDPHFVEDWQADAVSGGALVSTVALPDGSVARLAPDTALSWTFDQQQRHVTLLRGEAFFEVVPGSSPAFTVTSRGDGIRVVGTAFNVAQFNTANAVTVAHGAVRVTGERELAPVMLAPGEQVRIEDGRPGRAGTADLDAALSWMSGRLVVEQRPVGEVTQELGRYLNGRVVVRGGLGGRRVSGSFPLDDPSGSLDTLAAAIGARALHLPLMTIIY